ncbi:MAG: 2-dehydropantoate 2-reductase [Burkholderiales bacterium]|nr:2-dehydropantoate 2-reductase [Burkholderiales bacterium]
MPNAADPSAPSRPTVVVAGAGAIGCFVGGQLAAAGHDVRFLGRPRIVDELGRHGLTLTDRDGAERRVAPGELKLAVDPAVLAAADVVLVTVKSGATREIAASILQHAPAGAAIVSLQNGIDNAALLQQALPGRKVIAGMVPFNVAALGDGRFHRGTDGRIVIDATGSVLAGALATPLLPIETHADMVAIAWGKLLLNLNNALNALAGVPLREELANRDWRRVLAACIDEALAALRAAGIRPAKVGALPPALIPKVLRLPDALFRLVAAAQLRIDPKARSSMLDDLVQGRVTEIDQLQGRVVALAAEKGTPAPVNRAVLALVKSAEAKGAGSPRLSPSDVR